MKNKVRYIDGDPSKGIAYDWDKIIKKMKSLNIPPEFFNPADRPLAENAWHVIISERGTGKTSGYLILSALMYWMYGTVTVYCRALSTQIAPKRTSTLFDVVTTNGYVEKITDGKYNNVAYNRKYWYLCKTVDGEEVERDPNHFAYMVSVTEHAEIKSGLNLPTGDLIYFDEFMADEIGANGDESKLFLQFCDLISTIFRLRESGKIILLGNSLNKYSQILCDLEIADTVKSMVKGDRAEITTNSGTKIYVEMYNPDATFQAKKKSWVKRFMGFVHPELASITGQATWAVGQHPHIPDGAYRSILHNVYVDDNGKLARLEVVNHETLGLCMYVHWATAVYDDSIILTVGDIIDPRYHYGRGPENFAKLWQKFRAANRIYYASNDIGSFIDNYEHKITL